ncbi:MAG: toprim domain-containing protein, partial [Pseudoxanthomonas sp.]
VSDSKGIYKCFGCGAAGDGIKFVMEHEKKTFIESVKVIAEICGVELEEEKTETSEKYKEKLSAAQAQEEVLNFVLPMFRKNLLELPPDHPAKLWLKERNITKELVVEWNIGWAGADWHYITPTLINKGMHDAAAKLGIIKRGKDESNYDGYRSRITFCIYDKNGRPAGLAGRHIALGAENISPAKWVNPADCELYNKSATLYGLSHQRKSIRTSNHVYVVEGYMDVISPLVIGMQDVVAICGTAFTEGQIQLLQKEGVSEVTTFFDNDDAGERAFAKALPELLRHGFKVTRAKYEGNDADEFARGLKPVENDHEFYLPYPVQEDAVLYQVRNIMEEAAEDPFKNAASKAAVLRLVAAIKNDMVRSNYFDAITKKYKWKASDTKKEFTSIMDVEAPVLIEEESSTVKFFDWMSENDKEAFFETGYLSVNRKRDGKPMVGYYSFTSGGKSEITNFLINPLFHVYAGVESRYLLQIFNGYKNAVLDVPARIIPSIDQMQGMAVSEGNFVIFGAKPQWLRIASDLLQKFPRCLELKSLGWQTFGFYAWVDKIYIPGAGLKDLDNWGIIEHQGENFLVPASCEAYRMLQRTGEDPYENDRYLTYKESPATFSMWAVQMQKVYDQKGVVGIAYAILSLFRDVVFEVDNNCPHLYGFGEPSSGKSKWAESITAIFYFKRNAFNLNSGTDFAYFNYMQRYINSPNHLNEFDIEVIKPEWFQAIKGIYDGEGRERGKGGSKNRTEVMRVQGTLILTGQKLITADDNSVVTRSLIEPFSTNDERTEEDKKAYDLLKDWEQKGMSSMLVELLPHREFFEKNYKDLFNGQLSTWRKQHKQSRDTNQRI